MAQCYKVLKVKVRNWNTGKEEIFENVVVANWLCETHIIFPDGSKKVYGNYFHDIILL